jgi:hypothetical protein
MNKSTRHAQTLIARLRPLTIAALAEVTGGGESASTSTSGSPEAGDDTIGDTPSHSSPMTSLSLNFTKIEYR